jgi:hypothetical protein
MQISKLLALFDSIDNPARLDTDGFKGFAMVLRRRTSPPLLINLQVGRVIDTETDSLVDGVAPQRTLQPQFFGNFCTVFLWN